MSETLKVTETFIIIDSGITFQFANLFLYYLGENEMLSKVMQKISNDYEELKKAFESQKCPKDDKIQALRSTGL